MSGIPSSIAFYDEFARRQREMFSSVSETTRMLESTRSFFQSITHTAFHQEYDKTIRQAAQALTAQAFRIDPIASDISRAFGLASEADRIRQMNQSLSLAFENQRINDAFAPAFSGIESFRSELSKAFTVGNSLETLRSQLSSAFSPSNTDGLQRSIAAAFQPVSFMAASELARDYGALSIARSASAIARDVANAAGIRHSVDFASEFQETLLEELAETGEESSQTVVEAVASALAKVGVGKRFGAEFKASTFIAVLLFLIPLIYSVISAREQTTAIAGVVAKIDSLRADVAVAQGPGLRLATVALRTPIRLRPWSRATAIRMLDEADTVVITMRQGRWTLVGVRPSQTEEYEFGWVLNKHLLPASSH
jgi:hypothetical protein